MLNYNHAWSGITFEWANSSLAFELNNPTLRLRDYEVATGLAYRFKASSAAMSGRSASKLTGCGAERSQLDTPVCYREIPRPRLWLKFAYSSTMKPCRLKKPLVIRRRGPCAHLARNNDSHSLLCPLQTRCTLRDTATFAAMTRTGAMLTSSPSPA